MAKPLILVVEDEEPLTLLLRYNLEAEGYEVDEVARGDEAEVRLRERLPDLLVLDWMLPGLSGIELCRRLRARAETAQLPILMLTARGEEDERIRGLATGADDYVVKPFSVSELMARVKALLRRARPEAISPVLRAADLELDRETFRVRRNGREVHLGPTEFRLLEFLMKSPGRVFSREQLWMVSGPRRVRGRAHRRRPYRPAAASPESRPLARSDPHRARRGLRLQRAVRAGLNRAWLSADQVRADRQQKRRGSPRQFVTPFLGRLLTRSRASSADGRGSGV
jgi:two-component system phosphate regulon response regulator PhoB